MQPMPPVNFDFDLLQSFFWDLLTFGKSLYESVTFTAFGFTFNIWDYMLSGVLIAYIIHALAPWHSFRHNSSWGGYSD